MLTKQTWSIDVNDWEKINSEEEITELNNELVSQRISEITPQIISGLVALSGSSVFQANSNNRILAVKVKVGDKIKLQYPAGFLSICWSTELPVLNGTYTGFYSTRNQSSTWDALIYEATSEINGYLCVSAGNTYNVKFFKDNDTYAIDVKDEVVNLQNQVDLLQGELVEGDSITIKTGVIDGFCPQQNGYLVPKTGYKSIVFFARANKLYKITRDSSGASFIGRTLFYPYPNCTITNYTTSADTVIEIQPTTDTYIIVCVPTATTVAVTTTNTYIGKDVSDLKEGLVQTNESVEELGSNFINLNKTFNEQVLNDDELITIQEETATGVVIQPTVSTVQANSNYNIYAIPVTQGDTIFVTCNKTASGNMSFFVGYTEAIPALGVSCYDVILKEKTRWTDEEVVASRTGYYCVCCVNTVDIIAFKCLNSGLARRVRVLEDTVPHEGTLDMTSKIVTPSTVYELYPNNAFVALNRIYVEGLTASSDSDFNNSLMVDGRKNRFITNPTISATTKEYNISLLLSAEGYENKTITVPIRRTQPSNAKNKTINVMCIGDSLTQGGYPAIVEYIFKRLNDTQSDTSATMIGTKLLNVEIEYNGITKTCRGCHEGKGGAGISDYIRHLFMIRGGGTDSRYGMTISGKAAWDSLGLGTKTRNGSAAQPYETYTGSAAQKELMRTTCHGYYDADPSQELWDWRSVCYPEYGTFTYDGTTYTFGSSYSSDENAKIIAFVKWMCESNDFGTRRLPLYDKDTVESSNGQYAFNLSKYIDRFKTLANDGITRLVVGDTAGTLVTSVNSYDVCKPTHVVIIMNHNDLVQYGNVLGVISDLCLMADLVNEYDSNIHIALGSNRAYGAIDPKVYYDTIGMVGTFGANANLRDFYVALKECGTHGDILNIYQTATVKGACYQAVDTLTHADATLYNASDAFTHTQLESYLDRAYQIAAWVISRLES